MNPGAKGAARERQLRKLLESEGWFVTRCAGSLGCADLVALKAGERPRLVQIKANIGGPYKHFCPPEREELRRVATLAGAVAELAHWPPHGPLRWYDEAIWPG